VDDCASKTNDSPTPAATEGMTQNLTNLSPRGRARAGGDYNRKDSLCRALGDYQGSEPHKQFLTEGTGPLQIVSRALHRE
jgi:hypothetical protein